jgi:uncharacterized protein (TIGR02453 family)
MTETFSAATWEFLDRLAHDNTRATFEASRGTYHDHVAAPSIAFVERMAVLLPERVHPGLRAEAKVGRSLFRINRDTRFSKDKTPYKTHVDFLFWIGDGPPREQPACILRLTATDLVLGAGQVGLRDAALQRYRQRLDEPDDGTRLREIARSLAARGAVLSEPDRAKPPRPFPAEHPHAELLRRDGFHMTSRHRHPASVTTNRFPTWCAARLAPYRALLDWLADG